MNVRRSLSLAGVALAAALVVSPSRADVTQSVNATTNATVRPAGPRTGANGVRFFNVEGSSFGVNASFGVIRFNASALKSAFDTQFGAGSYTISGISLLLTESNAAFTRAGALDFAFSPDNTTDISAANTALKYDALNPPSSNQLDQEFITSGTFNTTGNVGSGTVDTYDLLTLNLGSTSLTNAILSGGIVTLIINDADTTVAATWAGATNTAGPPALRVTATAAIPEPSALALLLGGAPALLALRRRRA